MQAEGSLHSCRQQCAALQCVELLVTQGGCSRQHSRNQCISTRNANSPWAPARMLWQSAPNLGAIRCALRHCGSAHCLEGWRVACVPA